MSSVSYNNSSHIDVDTVVTVNDAQEELPYTIQVAILLAVSAICVLILLLVIFAILYCVGCLKRSPSEERSGSCCRRTQTSPVYVLEELENGYYQLTNKKIHTVQTKHGHMRVVNSPDDTVILEKKIRPAKEVHAWMPHTNPVRDINTSTK
ncbi:hypothetical protein CHS0354_009062 [Potamilus streckersoni]|uniref:Uncharacterized protein n=1 Tax=Potamilus streckersoni TaxID=2493646 RepID=A0AAE0WEP0_9BIVA|nr:hypothetical protein CHS0354_009062 [Potamilus streckersoni]